MRTIEYMSMNDADLNALGVRTLTLTSRVHGRGPMRCEFLDFDVNTHLDEEGVGFIGRALKNVDNLNLTNGAFRDVKRSTIHRVQPLEPRVIPPTPPLPPPLPRVTKPVVIKTLPVPEVPSPPPSNRPPHRTQGLSPSDYQITRMRYAGREFMGFPKDTVSPQVSPPTVAKPAPPPTSLKLLSTGNLLQVQTVTSPIPHEPHPPKKSTDKEREWKTSPLPRSRSPPQTNRPPFRNAGLSPSYYQIPSPSRYIDSDFMGLPKLNPESHAKVAFKDLSPTPPKGATDLLKVWDEAAPPPHANPIEVISV